MTELALRQDTSPVYADDPTGGRLVAWAAAAHAANQLARALCTTAFAPAHFKDNPGDTTAAIIAGDELGLSPLASMRAVYVVHGTPALYSRTMVALVQSKGHQVWTVKSTDSEVTVAGQRKGSDKTETSTWSITRAQKAGYTNNKKYLSNPQEMLYAKASAEVCRKIAADVLLGIGESVEDLELEDQPTVPMSRSNGRTTKVRRMAAPPPAEPEEPAFDEPPVDAEIIPDTITDPQMRKMQALFSEKGFRDRDDRLAYVTEIVGIEVESSKDLTKDQASQVIDALDQLAGVAS